MVCILDEFQLLNINCVVSSVCVCLCVLAGLVTLFIVNYII